MFSARTTIAPGPKTPAIWQLLRYSLSPLPFLAPVDDGCALRMTTPLPSIVMSLASVLRSAIAAVRMRGSSSVDIGLVRELIRCEQFTTGAADAQDEICEKYVSEELAADRSSRNAFGSRRG